MSDKTGPTDPGPALLEERSVLGILIHPFLVVVPGSILLALLVYRLSGHPFTVENARNALNWHLPFVGLFLVFLLLAFFVWEIFVFPAIVVGLFGGLCTFAFGIVATAKAIFGTAWEYPFAPELL